MYKVKDAADQLGVTRVEIFEVLLSQRELYDPYVKKNNSITYISEEGLQLLKSHFGSAQVPPHPVNDETMTMVEATQEMMLDEPEETFVETVFDEEAVNAVKVEGSIDIEVSDESVGKWLSEIQVEDQQATELDMRLKEMRSQVTMVRNKLMVLDSEMKRKDDALRHYHEIMKDDTVWMEDLEKKLAMLIERQSEAPFELDPEEMEDETERSNFFKFFKR